MDAAYTDVEIKGLVSLSYTHPIPPRRTRPRHLMSGAPPFSAPETAVRRRNPVLRRNPNPERRGAAPASAPYVMARDRHGFIMGSRADQASAALVSHRLGADQVSCPTGVCMPDTIAAACLLSTLPQEQRRPFLLDLDVVRAIGRLSASQRAAVALFHLEDRPVSDVARGSRLFGDSGQGARRTRLGRSRR